MTAFRGLKVYNTLTRAKEEFVPADPSNVRMYVCGPTVYDFAHIGNARPAIVFDVLFRLLRHLYGADHVTYVRNITDVDDKINARALRDYPGLPLNEAIHRVTEKTERQYHEDVAALGCLPPTFEPHATQHIPGMVAMIDDLIAKGHAYVAAGPEGREVLFDVASMPDYGGLSKRRLDEQQAGARIEVKDHKKNPADFVLWKESAAHEPGWDGHFHAGGAHVDIHGRPGWHIECSVMSKHHLGETFDIHGGGLDLIFPHHENEIAQSRCAHGTDVMAKYWMHNGFLQVEGRKMSKSEGNFVTIRDNLRGNFPGWSGGPWHGLVLRTAMLMTHYREPIDWTKDRLLEARSKVWKWYLPIRNWVADEFVAYQKYGFDQPNAEVDQEFIDILSNDLDTGFAISRLDELCEQSYKDASKLVNLMYTLMQFGFVSKGALKAYASISAGPLVSGFPVPSSEAHSFGIAAANADKMLMEELAADISKKGYSIRWIAPDQIDLKPHSDREVINVSETVDRRLAFIREKNWAEADRIRDELLAQGIQLKDGKDPATGERVTTWEVKR